ncbi:hypothetical protein Fcan01_24843 [Folsomia candida]|uniref:C2H2-type domain-containing protein n=1 Tax=Folsomia candida TaxID=158441 RepID=A0A226D495_FOLCA|nr:hypothetical protein Fcan01_24843 [Folsomia candida]
MEADVATELSAEVDSLKTFLSKSRQRIRQIARRAGLNTDQDKIGKLLNLLNEILSLTFADLFTGSTSLCGALGSTPTHNYADDHGDAFDHCEVDVKEELLCSSPIQEDGDFDPLYIPNEEDLGICIKPDNLDCSNNSDNDQNLVLKSNPLNKKTPPGQRINKVRQSRKEKVVKIGSKLSCQHVKNVNNTADTGKNVGSGEVKKEPGKPDLRIVLDRLNKMEFAKWKVQEPRPLQDCSSDDNDDHPDPDYNDDDYILPYSNPPSDDEYIPDNESAPSRKQKPCPASKKRKSSIRKKKNKSPVTCPYCGLVSNSSGSYRRHKMLFHTAADPRPRKAPISQCHLCDLRFGSKTSLATHLSTIHATQPLDDLTQFEVTDRPPGRTKFRNFRCPDCSKVIGQVQNFLNHRLIHSGEKPHPCPTCGLAFRKKGTLQRHCESQHLKEEKKFLCEHCPKSFLFKYTLVAHQNLMHPEGPRASFLCSKCPKEFTLKRNLERHMILVHEQLRSYKCPLCDKAFKQNAHLRYHLKTHENPGGRQRGLNRVKEQIVEEEDSMEGNT